jgi:hypothetical protein
MMRLARRSGERRRPCCNWSVFALKKRLNKSKFVIPAQAGIQEIQGTGFRLSPE